MGKYTDRLINTRGPKEGICNICGALAALSEDHTPPKGCISRVSQMEMRHIITYLGAENAIGRGRISQNGVKYKTICARCNNGLLGTMYDPAFIDFTIQVGRLLRTRLHLPSTMNINGKPQKIMRAVLGHLAAQGVDRYKKGPDTEPLRDYFIDPAAPLPDWINIYYWVYPFQRQVLVRDCALTDLRVKEPVLIWFMKFFPVAFMVTWREPAGYEFDLPNLAQHRVLGLEDGVDLPIHLDHIPHEYWPEAPTDHSIVTYGQEAIWAIEKSMKTKGKS